MKLSTFVLALVVSTAIHVGALTSNLLHVNAESIPDSNARTVKLHIVPAPTLAPSTPQPEVVEEIPDIPSTAPPETPAAKPPEVELTEKPIVAVKQLPVDLPAPPESIVPLIKESPKEWADSSRLVPVDVAENEDLVCEDCYASLEEITPLIPGPAKLISLETGVSAPAVINLTSKPKYPRYSRLHKEEGTTLLSVEILPDGTMGNVEVLESSGFLRLDQAAVKGIRKANLVPAMKDGEVVFSVEQIAIKFDLEDWGE